MTRALLRLRHAPGFTLFAVLTLTLGIGVTTAVYAVLYSGIWRPPGIAAADELVFLRLTNAATPRAHASISADDFAELRRTQTGLASLFAWSRVGTTLIGNGAAEIASGEAVSGTYFSELGVAPLRGRLLQPSDDEPGSAPVVVLSEQTWRRQFGSREDVVGATIRLSSRAATVVGVAPGNFRGVRASGYQALGFWMPLSRIGDVYSAYRRPESAPRSHFVMARLRADVPFDRAADEVARIGRHLDAASPLPARLTPLSDQMPAPQLRAWSLAPYLDGKSADDSEIARLILALPALVLIVACLNLANLLLSRGVSRRHELAVRAALGASRWRLIREQTVEGALLALAGTVGGLLLAKGLLHVGVLAVQSALADTIYNANQFDWQIDNGATAGAVMAGLIALLVAGVWPAVRLTRTHVRSALDLENAATSMPNWRGRGNMIALQVGASVGLFLIAAIFVRMVLRDATFLQSSDVDVSGVAIAGVPLELQDRDETRARRFVARVLDDLNSRPEIDGAGVTTASPLVPYSFASRGQARIARPDGTFKPENTHRPTSSLAMVTPGYLNVSGARLISGRGFSDADVAGAPRVAVVNEGLALDLFGTIDVVGRSMLMKPRDLFRQEPPTIETTIVGVVAGRKRDSRGGHDGHAYLSIAQEFDYQLLIFARARDRRSAPTGALREAIRRADPDLAVQYAVDADQLATGPRSVLEIVAGTLIGMAATTLLLSMTGLYGVLSHVVFRRTREMGVRIALGADRRRIARLILKDGFRPIAEGLFIGLGTATALRIFLRSQMAAPVAPIDPLAFALAAVLLFAAGGLACFIPARRATRVDPNVALREL